MKTKNRIYSRNTRLIWIIDFDLSLPPCRRIDRMSGDSSEDSISFSSQNYISALAPLLSIDFSCIANYKFSIQIIPFAFSPVPRRVPSQCLAGLKLADKINWLSWLDRIHAYIHTHWNWIFSVLRLVSLVFSFRWNPRARQRPSECMWLEPIEFQNMCILFAHYSQYILFGVPIKNWVSRTEDWLIRRTQ